jgi:hypothetical protein
MHLPISISGRVDKALSTICMVVSRSPRLAVTVTGVTPLSKVIITCVSLGKLNLNEYQSRHLGNATEDCVVEIPSCHWRREQWSHGTQSTESVF